MSEDYRVERMVGRAFQRSETGLSSGCKRNRNRARIARTRTQGGGAQRPLLHREARPTRRKRSTQGGGAPSAHKGGGHDIRCGTQGGRSPAQTGGGRSAAHTGRRSPTHTGRNTTYDEAEEAARTAPSLSLSSR